MKTFGKLESERQKGQRRLLVVGTMDTGRMQGILGREALETG